MDAKPMLTNAERTLIARSVAKKGPELGTCKYPRVWPEGIFKGEGGCVCFEAFRGRIFIRPPSLPLSYGPPPLEGYFRGGVYKICPPLDQGLPLCKAL